MREFRRVGDVAILRIAVHQGYVENNDHRTALFA